MFVLEMTRIEASTLTKLLATRCKEIHAWRVATKSQVRDEEYDRVATLLKNISQIEEK